MNMKIACAFAAGMVFGSASAADVSAEWLRLCEPSGVSKIVAQQGQTRPKIVAPGALLLPADGPKDNIWDFPMKLDLSDAAAVEFDISISDVSVFKEFPLYFRSGRGWYHAGMSVEQAIERQHVSVKVGGTSCEGVPAGWDRIDGFRIRAYRSVSTPAQIRMANFRVIPKAEVADTPERRAKLAAEREKRLAETAKWLKTLPARRGERRLIWVHSANGIKIGHRKFIGWDEAVREVRACGYTDLIANLCWGSTASYESKVLPKPTPDEFAFLYKEDQFELCKAACRKYGVKFHPWRVCWMTMWRNTKEEQAAMLAKGVLTVDARGEEKTGAWSSTFCPSHPENRRREIAAMCELADKGCDGIHFDYIRYQGPDKCFCPGCRARFAEATGLTFANWPQDMLGDPAATKRWQDWRCGNITAVVRAVHDYVKKRHPKTEISIAARSGIGGARHGDGQDWVAWAKEGLVDFICPMDYTAVTPLFRNIYREQAEAIRGTGVALYPGIGISCWGEDDGDNARRFAKHVLQLREDGCRGFTVFALEQRDLPALRLMATGPFAGNLR